MALERLYPNIKIQFNQCVSRSISCSVVLLLICCVQFSPKKIMPPILSCITSPLPDSTHASDKPRHQFRPSRSVTSTPQKPGESSPASNPHGFSAGCHQASVPSSLTASRSLTSSPSRAAAHYDTHSGRHPNKTSPSGSYSQTAPRSEHTPSPLKHPGSHHTPDAP